MRVAGLGSPNDSGSAKDVGQEAWPASAKRLAKLAWAITFRVRKATGTVEASMALADDDVMLLCQGLEVLEALSDCSADFFEGRRSRREEYVGEGPYREQRGCFIWIFFLSRPRFVVFRFGYVVSIVAPDRPSESSTCKGSDCHRLSMFSSIRESKEFTRHTHPPCLPVSLSPPVVPPFLFLADPFSSTQCCSSRGIWRRF